MVKLISVLLLIGVVCLCDFTAAQSIHEIYEFLINYTTPYATPMDVIDYSYANELRALQTAIWRNRFENDTIADNPNHTPYPLFYNTLGKFLQKEMPMLTTKWPNDPLNYDQFTFLTFIKDSIDQLYADQDYEMSLFPKELNGSIDPIEIQSIIRTELERLYVEAFGSEYTTVDMDYLIYLGEMADQYNAMTTPPWTTYPKYTYY